MTLPTRPDPDFRAPADFWLERAAAARALLAELAGQRATDLLARLSAELELGLIETHLAGRGSADAGARPGEHLHMATRCGAALALARVLARRGSGFRVELRWPAADGGEHFLGIDAAPSPFGWPDWLTAFSLALIAGDEQALAVLGTADCVDACALPLDQVDRFWPFLCAAFAALWQHHPSTAALLGDAGAQMDDGGVMDAAVRDATLRPLIAVGLALAGATAGARPPGGDAALTDAAQAALGRFRQRYAAEPEGGRDPDGLFDLPLSALLAEAGRRGLGTSLVAEDLLPAGAGGGTTTELVCVYPRLAILSAVEAEWLMQNEGFARHGRSVVVQADDGVPVARYRAEDAPGIPLAELEFELLDAGLDRPFDGSHAPPALDVGELLARAERLASTPLSETGGAPVYDLPQAVEALDLAMVYLAAMPGGFDPRTLHSERGRRLYEAEPGRFRPERVLVYRNALAREAGLAERELPAGPAAGAGVPAEPAGTAEDAEQQAVALAEELVPLLLPLLGELALDETGAAHRALKPRDEDYALAFEPDMADVACRHYADFWARFVPPLPMDPDTRIDAHLAPAGMLGDDNALSRPFPRGFLDVAPWLNPHRIWACWRYLPADGGAGIAMNGLVWLDDHWAWFPKPWRVLGEAPRH